MDCKSAPSGSGFESLSPYLYGHSLKVELRSPKPSVWVQFLLPVLYGGCGEVVNTSDCGSDIRGSIPSLAYFNIGVSPSGKARDFDSLMRWFESSYPSSTICRRGGIGRRAGLKIQCPQGRAGSTPAGIVYEETLIYQRFFLLCLAGRVVLGSEYPALCQL